MSSPGTQDDSVSGILVQGDAETLTGLLGISGVSVAFGSTADDDDGNCTVVAYVTASGLQTLQSSGYDITVLDEPSDLESQWDTVYGQIEQ